MIWALAYIPALAGLAIWALGGPRARIGTLGAATALATLALAAFASGATGRIVWSDTLVLQAALPPLALAMALTLPVIAGVVVIFAAAHEKARGLPRLIGLMMVFVGGMELVVIADDLVTLLIGWEIVGACSWALIGHKWRATAPGASANFAFVVTRAGDLGLFLALFATFAGTGGIGYEALAELQGGYLALAAFGLLVAAASKSGQVPFAPWLFRAMDGPTSVSALLHSATMVAAGVYILARLQPQLSQAPGFNAAAMGVGLATAILGGWVALRQTHAKKLLAGSTSAQMGLMIATVGAGFPGIAMLHLVVHAAMKAALFFAAGIAHRATGSFDLREMGLGRTLPVCAILTCIAAASLAAVPPFAGGWSKEEMIKALEHVGPLVAVLAIVAGGLTAAYATRFALAAFGPGDAQEATAPKGEIAALASLVAVTLALSGLWWPPVHDAAAAWLGAELPQGTRLGLIASLAAVAFGVLAGLRMAREKQDAPASVWLGLATLFDEAVIRPFHVLAGHAARADDSVLDLIPRGVAALAHRVADATARGDDDLLDGLAPGATRRAQAGASRAWRGAVAAAVAGTATLAALSARGGERLSDLIPTGTGRVAGMAGADLRRLQTGLAHHYYSILVAGFALALGLLIFGA